MEFSRRQLKPLTWIIVIMVLLTGTSCNDDELKNLKQENKELRDKLMALEQNYIFDSARIRVEQDTLKDYFVGDIYDFSFSVVAYNEEDLFHPSENDTLQSKAVIDKKNGVYHYRRLLSDTTNYIKIDFSVSGAQGKKIEGSLYDIITAKK